MAEQHFIAINVKQASRGDPSLSQADGHNDINVGTSSITSSFRGIPIATNPSKQPGNIGAGSIAAHRNSSQRLCRRSDLHDHSVSISRIVFRLSWVSIFPQFLFWCFISFIPMRPLTNTMEASQTGWLVIAFWLVMWPFLLSLWRKSGFSMMMAKRNGHPNC